MFKIAKRKLRILDFDSECRPMHYSEWKPESQITAIAWSWVGEEKVHVETLARNLKNENRMLARFLVAYAEADVVTGHYIRKHDLPLLNDHVVRAFGEAMRPKLTQDTMIDFTSVKSLGKSQDNLAVMFGLTEEKHHMTGADWRAANSLTTKGIDLAKIRVVNDVIQHKALRQAIINRGLLGEPQLWIP